MQSTWKHQTFVKVSPYFYSYYLCEYQYSSRGIVCICAPLACFIYFHVTNTTLAVIWMWPLAKRDVMIVLRDVHMKSEGGVVFTGRS